MCLSGGCGFPERGETISEHAESLSARKIKLADPVDATARAKSTTKVLFVCLNPICNFIWNTPPYIVIAAARPTGCPHCGKGRKPLCPAEKNCQICVPKSLFAQFTKLLLESGLTFIGSQDARTIRANTNVKLSFKHTCGHTIEMAGCEVTSGHGCGYCSNPPRHLCPSDAKCAICLPKSVAGAANALAERKVEYDAAKNKKPADQVFLNSNNFIWWRCKAEECNHTWRAAPNNVCGKPKRGCGYCSSQRICPSDAKCTICLRKTVAGATDALAEREVEYDAAKNHKPTDQVFLGSNTSIWWKCKAMECNHTWRAPPYSVCGMMRGCGKCTSAKTEKLVFERLLELTATAQRDFRAIWCTNTSSRALPFDMVAHVDSSTGVQLDVIVEVDGRQHFGAIPHFNKSRSYQDILNIDLYKMQCALSAGYHVVRVHQEDAWHRRVNVLAELAGVLEEIRHASAPGVWLIAVDKEVYVRHALDNGEPILQPEPNPSRKRKEPA